MQIIKKIFSTMLRISISIILLIFLFKQVDKKSLLEIIKGADKNLLFFAFLLFFCSYVLCLYRWEMLLKTAKVHLPLMRVIISFAGGIFFNIFLPSTIGGDLVRSIDLAAHTKKPKEIVATVILDRLSGYVGLVFIAILALLFGWRLIHDKSVIFSVFIITTILIVILLILFNNFLFTKASKFLDSSHSLTKKGGSSTLNRIKEILKNIHQEIYIFRHQKTMILNNLIISILLQTITPLTFYLTALSLGIKINMLYFFILLPIIGAITLLPISIGGLGIREYTTKLFFAKVGVSTNLALAMSLLNSFFILLYASIGGLIYVITVNHRRGRV